MKFLCLIWNESKGIRFSALLLAVFTFFSLYTTVQITGSMRYIERQYAFASESPLENAFYFNPEGLLPDSFADPADYHAFIERDGMGEILRGLAAGEDVALLGTRAGAGSFFNRQDYAPERSDKTAENAPGVSLVLLSPDLLTLFPALKERMPFDDPDAVYLFGDLLPTVRPGDTLSLFTTVPSENGADAVFFTFSLADRLEEPLTIPRTEGGGSRIDVDHVAAVCDPPVLFLLDTPENEAMLAEKGVSVTHSNGFYLTYRDGVPEARRKAVEESLSAYGKLMPLREMAEDLRQSLRREYEKQLPLSLVLLGITTVSYFSVIALTVSKKRKETAVEYLCGGSKNRLAAGRTAMLFLVILLPAVLNLLYVALAGFLSKRRFLSLYETVIDGKTALLLLLYSAGMLLIAWLITRGMLGKKSPITYFKETTK